MPPCVRATVGPSWERSWPSSTKRCSVGLPSPDRERRSRGSLHSSRTLGSGLPISTLFSLVLNVAGKKCQDPKMTSSSILEMQRSEWPETLLNYLYPRRIQVGLFHENCSLPPI